MLRMLIVVGLVVAGLGSSALAEEGTGETGSEGAEVLQPVLDDDTAVNPGSPDDQPISPVLDDDSGVNPGSEGDQPLEPVLDDDSEVNLPPETGGRDAPEMVLQKPITLHVPLRADGSVPQVRLQRADNGKDSEVWVDGVKRVILKGRANLRAEQLNVVFA